MYLDYTPEQERLRAEIRATLEQVMTPQRSAAISGRIEGGPEVRECVRALAAANLLGVGWPKEYGGRGFSAIEQFIFAEEARRVNAPMRATTYCRFLPAPRSTAIASPTKTCSTSRFCFWWPAMRPPAT